MTARELEQHVSRLLRRRDLAHRLRIDSVVQPTDLPEWWIDIIDCADPHDVHQARIVLPTEPDWDRTLGIDLIRTLDRIAANELSEGAARRCPLCGHTAILGHHRRRAGEPFGPGSGHVAAWRCQNRRCVYVEQVSL